MSGRYIDKIGAGSGGQLADLEQGELTFSLHLKLNSAIFPRITLGVGLLLSNGYLHIVQHVWKVH